MSVIIIFPSCWNWLQIGTFLLERGFCMHGLFSDKPNYRTIDLQPVWVVNLPQEVSASDPQRQPAG